MDEPLVTILMTCYNSEKTITKAIESVILQSYKNWELIIIDDKSTDKSVEIINKLKNNNYKIHLIQNSINSGTYLSLNYGLKISNGDFITKLDSDDYYHKDKILMQIKYCLNNNYQVSSCNIVRFDNNGLIKQECTHSSILFSRKVFNTIGYFDNLRFGCDSEYYDRIKKIFKIIHVPKNLYFSLIRQDSLTQDPKSGLRKNNGNCLGYQIRSAYKKNYLKYIDFKMIHPKFIRNYSTHPTHKSPLEIEFNKNVEIFDSNDQLIFYSDNNTTIGKLYFKFLIDSVNILLNKQQYELYISDINGNLLVDTTKKKEIRFIAKTKFICVSIFFKKGFNVYQPLHFEEVFSP